MEGTETISKKILYFYGWPIIQIVILKRTGEWDVSWATILGFSIACIAIPSVIDWIWQHKKAMIIAEPFGFITPDRQMYQYSELTCVQSTPGVKENCREISLTRKSQKILLCQHIPFEESAAFMKLLKNLIEERCDLITYVIFGEWCPHQFQPTEVLFNPDTSNLILPLYKLKRLYIHCDTYDSKLVEQFLDYAVTIIGNEYLKRHVGVELYGIAEKISPYLQNTLNDLMLKIHRG